MSRFASITADILARKGEARPWREVADESAKRPLAWQSPPQVADVMPVSACERVDDAAVSFRKCTVRMSQHDYERLGILAVKQGTTRHRLLQEAIGRLFTGMKQEFGSSCRCLGTTSR